MIRIDHIGLSAEPLDMRAGFNTALTRVIRDFGAAHPDHANVFANRSANRIKVLVHDGFGLWLASRRLNKGRFFWCQSTTDMSLEQLRALVIGLPWKSLGEAAVLRVI